MRVSLHMIVRNAEGKLARTLDSIHDLVDEMVIVDTGSTDGTKEIAESYGAQVYDFEWGDDFSAARNFALSKTTGDWITWLDAGDVLTLKGRERFRFHLANTCDITPTNYILGELNREYDDWGNPKIVHLVSRLVKKTPSTRWQCPIHEAFVLDNAVVVTDNDFTTDDPDGYQSSSAERNLAIMDKWVAEGVDTVRNWTLRAVELEKLGRYEEAVQGSDEAHNLQMLPDNFAEYYLSVGRSYLKMGNEEMARVTLLKSALHNPLVPDPWVLLGDIEFLANKHKRAAPYYMASLPALPNGQFWVKNVPYHTYEPLEKLGHCYAHMGDFTKGIGFLERAVACSPAKGPVKAHIKKTIQELRKMKK